MPDTVHIAITDPEAWLARGHTFPKTVWQWRYLYRNRSKFGLDSAFRKIGVRIIVDEAAYLEATRQAAAARGAA